MTSQRQPRHEEATTGEAAGHERTKGWVQQQSPEAHGNGARDYSGGSISGMMMMQTTTATTNASTAPRDDEGSLAPSSQHANGATVAPPLSPFREEERKAHRRGSWANSPFRSYYSESVKGKGNNIINNNNKGGNNKLTSSSSTEDLHKSLGNLPLVSSTAVSLSERTERSTITSLFHAEQDDAGDEQRNKTKKKKSATATAATTEHAFHNSFDSLPHFDTATTSTAATTATEMTAETKNKDSGGDDDNDNSMSLNEDDLFGPTPAAGSGNKKDGNKMSFTGMALHSSFSYLPTATTSATTRKEKKKDPLGSSSHHDKESLHESLSNFRCNITCQQQQQQQQNQRSGYKPAEKKKDPLQFLSSTDITALRTTTSTGAIVPPGDGKNHNSNNKATKNSLATALSASVPPQDRRSLLRKSQSLSSIHERASMGNLLTDDDDSVLEVDPLPLSTTQQKEAVVPEPKEEEGRSNAEEFGGGNEEEAELSLEDLMQPKYTPEQTTTTTSKRGGTMMTAFHYSCSSLANFSEATKTTTKKDHFLDTRRGLKKDALQLSDIFSNKASGSSSGKTTTTTDEPDDESGEERELRALWDEIDNQDTSNASIDSQEWNTSSKPDKKEQSSTQDDDDHELSLEDLMQPKYSADQKTTPVATTGSCHQSCSSLPNFDYSRTTTAAKDSPSKAANKKKTNQKGAKATSSETDVQKRGPSSNLQQWRKWKQDGAPSKTQRVSQDDERELSLEDLMQPKYNSEATKAMATAGACHYSCSSLPNFDYSTATRDSSKAVGNKKKNKKGANETQNQNKKGPGNNNAHQRKKPEKKASKRKVNREEEHEGERELSLEDLMQPKYNTADPPAALAKSASSHYSCSSLPNFDYSTTNATKEKDPFLDSQQRQCQETASLGFYDIFSSKVTKNKSSKQKATEDDDLFNKSLSSLPSAAALGTNGSPAHHKRNIQLSHRSNHDKNKRDASTAQRKKSQPQKGINKKGEIKGNNNKAGRDPLKGRKEEATEASLDSLKQRSLATATAATTLGGGDDDQRSIYRSPSEKLLGKEGEEEEHLRAPSKRSDRSLFTSPTKTYNDDNEDTLADDIDEDDQSWLGAGSSHGAGYLARGHYSSSHLDKLALPGGTSQSQRCERTLHKDNNLLEDHKLMSSPQRQFHSVRGNRTSDMSPRRSNNEQRSPRRHGPNNSERARHTSSRRGERKTLSPKSRNKIIPEHIKPFTIRELRRTQSADHGRPSSKTGERAEPRNRTYSGDRMQRKAPSRSMSADGELLNSPDRKSPRTRSFSSENGTEEQQRRGRSRVSRNELENQQQRDRSRSRSRRARSASADKPEQHRPNSRRQDDKSGLERGSSHSRSRRNGPLDGSSHSSRSRRTALDKTGNRHDERDRSRSRSARSRTRSIDVPLSSPLNAPPSLASSALLGPGSASFYPSILGMENHNSCSISDSMDDSRGEGGFTAGRPARKDRQDVNAQQPQRSRSASRSRRGRRTTAPLHVARDGSERRNRRAEETSEHSEQQMDYDDLLLSERESSEREEDDDLWASCSSSLLDNVSVLNQQ